jgi:class 3 adenylate cyclase/tetratricopeptide (TPR) repeat protein
MVNCPACGRENPDGFAFCGFCAAPLAEVPARAGVEERKVVSVLFCDLVGFTAASEVADPEDVRARLRPYHELLRERIEAFGGTVEKFVGDAVMAVFGAPTAHEDDAERSIRAALSILESLTDLNASDPSLSLQVRVGVNTGEALVAVDAKPEQGEGFVTGDVVNTASRIQGAAPVGGVAVGADTYQATARVFEWEELEPVELKGKGAPVALWRPLHARARFGTDVLRTLTTPLVGRELEVQQLRTVFERVRSDSAVQLVTLVGEPGVGKSRLVAELLAYVDGLPGFTTWRQGRCLPYGEGITYWALGEIVKAHAGVLDTDSSDEAASKLRHLLPEGEDGSWLSARILPLLGVDTGAPVTRDESFAAWRRFLESIAETEPTVLVFEDIHWADEALLAFLEHLADWAQGVPMLVVCTARPELYEKPKTWGAGLRNATTVNLAPLSFTDTSRLVSALLDQAVLPAETQQLLLDRAGGNPLYAEEFARMLRDRELLDERGRLRDGADLSLPDSLQALIAARLDTLAPDRKSLLQDAAVIGKVFWPDAVAEMGGRERREVDDALHELSRKELVRHSRQSSMEGEQELGFWHVLVRDVAYAQIPRGERAAKHARAAEWLERKAGERVEDVAEVLAFHTGEAIALARATGDQALAAELAPAARRYALLAGERALGLDVPKALRLLERAVELARDDDATYPAALSAWAEAAHHAGDIPGAAAAVERAVATLRERGDTMELGRALSRLSLHHHYLGDPRAVSEAKEAVSLLETQPGPELVAALGELAGTYVVASEFAAAVAAADRAVDVAAKLGLPEPARALSFRGSARANLGDRGGLAELERAAELLLAQGRARDAAVAIHNRASLSHEIEGPASWVTGTETVLALAEARGVAMAGVGADRLGGLVDTGRLAEVIEVGEDVIADIRAIGNLVRLPMAEANLARALCETGALQRATEFADRALADTPDASQPDILDDTRAGVIRVLTEVGRFDEARTLLETAARERAILGGGAAVRLPALVRSALASDGMALAKQLCEGIEPLHPMHVAGVVAARAQLLEASGELRPAADGFQEVAERWRILEARLERAYALLGVGRCLSALGDPSAEAMLIEARRHFTDMGARPRVAECDAQIARLSTLTM